MPTFRYRKESSGSALRDNHYLRNSTVTLPIVISTSDVEVEFSDQNANVTFDNADVNVTFDNTLGGV